MYALRADFAGFKTRLLKRVKPGSEVVLELRLSVGNSSWIVTTKPPWQDWAGVCIDQRMIDSIPIR